MDILKGLIKEFGFFQPGTDTGGNQTGDDFELDFGGSAGDDTPAATDDTVTVDDPTANGECKCQCPCCNHGKEGADDADANIQIIDPQTDTDVDFDIDSEDTDSDDDNDPMKDYDIF